MPSRWMRVNPVPLILGHSEHWRDEGDCKRPCKRRQAGGKGDLVSCDVTRAMPMTRSKAIEAVPTVESRYELESIDIDDQVSIELPVAHGGERYRALDQLSTGQECTAILHLLLLDNRDPLVMDQPDGNLDNAFIAERIVQELREAETERQLLFATHNANIQVFGDAEWIGVCSASDEHAEMPAEMQGSIDIPGIRNSEASILEGGKETFM